MVDQDQQSLTVRQSHGEIALGIGVPLGVGGEHRGERSALLAVLQDLDVGTGNGLAFRIEDADWSRAQGPRREKQDARQADPQEGVSGQSVAMVS
jgi:hypothetical protein